MPTTSVSSVAIAITITITITTATATATAATTIAARPRARARTRRRTPARRKRPLPSSFARIASSSKRLPSPSPVTAIVPAAASSAHVPSVPGRRPRARPRAFPKPLRRARLSSSPPNLPPAPSHVTEPSSIIARVVSSTEPRARTPLVISPRRSSASSRAAAAAASSRAFAPHLPLIDHPAVHGFHRSISRLFARESDDRREPTLGVRRRARGGPARGHRRLGGVAAEDFLHVRRRRPRAQRSHFQEERRPRARASTLAFAIVVASRASLAVIERDVRIHVRRHLSRPSSPPRSFARAFARDRSRATSSVSPSSASSPSRLPRVVAMCRASFSFEFQTTDRARPSLTPPRAAPPRPRGR